MGLDENGIKLMLYANKIGVDFKKVVTIGRQGLHLTHEQLLRQLSLFGFGSPEHFNIVDSTYSESLFTLLGADDVQSIDNSAYEGATIVHDMNQPLDDKHKGQYSVVVDAGTLEHVFNFPVAIKNCMEMCRKGGVFISITPTNNFMGHGFYQFSPELFFSMLNLNNGFEIVKLLVCEDYDGAQWYEVRKPKGDIAGRVTLVNHHPAYMMCIARRLDDICEPFKNPPQQSAYIEAWSNTDKPSVKPKVQIVNRPVLFKYVIEVLRAVPFFKQVVRNVRYLRKPVFPVRDYTPFYPIAKVDPLGRKTL